MTGRIPKPEDDVLHLIMNPATCSKCLGLGIRGEVVYVALEQPVGLETH